MKPELGRGFFPESPSYASKNANLIVLSDIVWKEAFNADKSILGRTVKINDTPYTVAGVMPRGFQFPAVTTEGSHAWVWVGNQLGTQDSRRGWGSDHFIVIARLRPGIPIATARAEMQTIQNHVAATITDFQERKESSRATIQRYEIAMRRALGASRWRVVQQMLIEGLVLCSCGAILGAGLAVGSVRLLAHELTQRLPLPVPAKPDGLVLAVLLGLTLISALLSSTWPAFIAARAPIESALRQRGVQSGMGRHHHRMRGILVSIEVAMSLTLLVACGMLLRTIYSLRHVPLGYRTDHIIVASLDIPSFRFAQQDMTHVLYDPLLERIQNLPGVQAAGLVSEIPLGNTFAIHFEMQLNNNTKIVSYMKSVTPDIQKVLGFKMAAGRYFNSQDTATSQPVVVVNEAFAHLYSPDKNNPHAIIGTQLLKMRSSPTQIIGILADTRQRAVSDPSQPEVQIDIQQLTPDVAFYNALEGIAMDVALRTNWPTSEVFPELRQLLRHASPELASARITTMDQIVADSYGSQSLATHLLEIFGFSALLLCIAGLYVLLAYVVSQRTREIGVRIALGAGRGDLVWMIMRQAGTMLFTGTVVGLALSWASARLVRGFLFGVKTHDDWAIAAAVALLLLSGLTAAYLPARRAARVDPMEALRAE